jgi:UDP-2,3-diacylglucosamine pyrophosphatase LpxH
MKNNQLRSTGENISPRPHAAFTRQSSRLPVALLLCILVLFTWTCASVSFRYMTEGDTPPLPEQPASYPATRFIVFSDPHFTVLPAGVPPTDTPRGTGLGKLLHESHEIGLAAVRYIRANKPAFVLVPGDLTENGRLTEHRSCISLLHRLETNGIPVYVIPGNHDIHKAQAGITPGNSVTTPARFAEMYRDFGYGDAVSRDPASLSYVAEPVKGLWLLALDATVYREDEAPPQGHDGTIARKKPAKNYGYDRFSLNTLLWAEHMLRRAAARGKAVMVMMHYGLLEHFKLQKQTFPRYVVDNFTEIARMIAHYRGRIVFTGHFHSQDITIQRYPDGGFIYDIETGSLITYPCALRLVSFSSGSGIRITSHYITAIPSHPKGFPEYAHNYLVKSVRLYFSAVLGRYGFSAKERKLLIPQLSAALVAHITGDEHAPPVLLDVTGLSLWHKIMISFRRKQFEYIRQDLPPPDNNIRINPLNGEWQKLTLP